MVVDGVDVSTTVDNIVVDLGETKKDVSSGAEGDPVFVVNSFIDEVDDNDVEDDSDLAVNIIFIRILAEIFRRVNASSLKLLRGEEFF